MACNGPIRVSPPQSFPARTEHNTPPGPRDAYEILTSISTGGGLSLTRNRTYWPTTGGALAFQPGWFSGHATAYLYVNIGLDTDGPDGGPMNFTNSLEKPWQLLGPSNGPYPGTLCLPDVKVPSNLGIKAGDNATIQIVELATHGASLFAVSSNSLPPAPPTPIRAEILETVLSLPPFQ